MDLINKEDALSEVNNCNYKIMSGYEWIRKQEIKKRLKELPSAETDLSEYSDKLWKNAYERGKAEAERTGRNISQTGFLCSECSFGDFDGFHGYKPKYCPNCGARMIPQDIRDCDHCTHHTDNGCTKWDCEFERVSVKPLERKEFKMTDEVIPGGDPWKNWSDSLIRERRTNDD